MEFNSFKQEYTTPSKKLYYHGWLWDSVIAAIGWSYVKEKRKTDFWKNVDREYKRLRKSGLSIHRTEEKVASKFRTPLFDEYFSPITSHGYAKGEPMGSIMMTWTAAIYIDLLSRKN